MSIHDNGGRRRYTLILGPRSGAGRGDGRSGVRGRGAGVAAALTIAAALLGSTTACSSGSGDHVHGETAAVSASPQAQTPSAHPATVGSGSCADSSSKNLSFQDLADLGLLAEGYRPMMEPILAQVPPGNYARFVTAVCPAVHTSGQDNDLAAHGELAKFAAGTCLGLDGSKTVDELIQRFSPSLSDSPALTDWNITYSHALADYFCPQRFRR